MASDRAGNRLPSLLILVVVVTLITTAFGSPVLSGLTTPAGASSPTTITQTFGFTNSVQTFTVPAGVTSLTLTATGGQGGWGGADASGNPPDGGYQGQVTGTIPVTPGDYLTIAVGSGADEPIDTGCTRGNDASSPVDADDAVPGENPLPQYDGGMGGAPGPNGCSGYGGAGGAASVVEIGSSSSAPTSIGTVVAGGGGGDGGSGQYALVRGQINLANYVPQSTPTSLTYGLPAGCTTSCTSHNTIETPSPLPTSPTQGQPGIAVFTLCGGSTNGNNADQYFNTGAPDSEPGCDGGGGAGGGGGAAGGSAGNVQFGSGSSDEWYGQGGSPGENSTVGLTGLSALYSYYADADTGAPTVSNTFADPGSSFDGSVVLTYASGVPGIPGGVSGTAGNGDVALQWSAPSAGADPISDYVIQYSSNGGTSWTTDDTGSTATSATVSGLTNGTGYIFEVEAVNSVGDGPFSSPTGTLTPSGPPGAPTITSLTPQDGGLLVNFTAPASTAPITGYLYQLDGVGPWFTASAASSPLTISGLTDGTAYSVQIEAVNAIGTGAPSNSLTQTPVAVPGAPTISSVAVGSTTASVSFTPGSDGGSTITGYRYSTDDGTTWTTTSTTSPVAVIGLSDGATYTFELEATNVSGNGAPATTSFNTTAPPSAPVIGSIASGDEALTVSFAAPASGGSPITDYDWSTDGGTNWYSEDAAGTPCQDTSDTVTCAVDTLSTDGQTPLTNGVSYPIQVRAVNAVGTGPASASEPGTPFTTPGAPTITSGADGMVAANQSLTVTFTAPTSDGGSAITGYQYSTDAGATWQDRTDGQPATSTTTTITAVSADGVTPLVDGVTYDVEIRAVNAAGEGPGSAVATGIPVTVPDAPTITSVGPENGALAVAFAPASNGGSAITAYEYSLNGGSWTSTGSLSPLFTIGGLVNGTSYAVEVRADNAQGSSAASAAVSGTPVTVPGQPTITSTTRGNATITISYTAPIDGGSPILNYQYSTDAGTTWQDASSAADPMLITALSTDGTTPISNGTEYPVEIRAVNAAGDSLASVPVEAAPATVPGAPTVTLTPGDASIGVTASITDDGGSSVTGLDYSLDGSPFTSTGTTSPTFTIPGLVNGTSYTVSVRADNAIGNGAASAPASAIPLTVPGAPTNVVAASDSASADVSWTAPASDGGSVITGYTATAYTSQAGTTTAGTACTTASLACSVTGLTNGTTYYVGVVATNAAGSSVTSSPLQAVTPIARPGAPTVTAVNSGNSYLSVAFTAGSAGGDPITSYQYSLDEGNIWTAASGTVSPLIIDGLTDGTTYTVLLRAVSAAGPGAASSPQTGTPYTYPDAVSASSITANGENASAVVSWAAPAWDGGAPISNQTVSGVADAAYTVTAFNSASGGTQLATCTTSGALSCTLTSLTNGTTYYISIQAGNAAGLSARSTPRVPVTPSIDPGPVSAVTAAAGDGQAAVSWTPGSTGQSAITNYLVSYSSGGSYTQFAHPASTATSTTVTGLSNGTTYTFEVAAVNAQGTGTASAPSNAVTPSGPTISSPALSGGEIGVAYDATPAVSGGTAPYTWSVTGGSLPDGLSIDPSTGEIAGTPTTTGTATFTVEVTDAVNGTATQTESVDILSAPSFTSAPLTGGEVGVAYAGTPAVSGGTGTYTWSVTGGSLPDGLSLDPSSGAVTGFPTAAGAATFTLVATDTDGGSAIQPESVEIVGGPAVTSAPLPGGEVGAADDATPAVSGGTAPYTWSVTGGSLPEGLSIDPSSGAITGTPTTPQTATFTLVVRDALGQEATQGESIAIATAPSITSEDLPGGEVGLSYDATPAADGGTAPYTWSVTEGSLPAGLILDPSTGEITGTSTTTGTATFTLEATDADGESATQLESIDILTAVSFTSAPLPGGEVGAVYDATSAVSGGTGTYTWSLTGGALPAGLILDPSTGEITGVPTTAGTVTFTLTATDTDGGSAGQTESVDIAAAPSLTSPGFPAGEVGVAYDISPSVSGGTGPYTWSTVGGPLPAGLSLDSSTGEISGVPTAAGSATFLLVAEDTLSQDAVESESIAIAVDPTITSTPAPGGETGAAYEALPTVSGGTAPFAWSVTGGSLPDGVVLDTTTGAITGMPTVPGTTTFTLVVTDGLGQQATQDESIDVANVPAIVSPALAGGEAGATYDAAPSVAYGTGPFTWSVTGGSLPDGLSLDPSTGEITGIPTSSGTFDFDLQVTDADSESAGQAETITIAAIPSVVADGTLDAKVGVPVSDQLAVQGGTAPFAWTVTSGSLPPGVVLAPSGLLSGMPGTAGTFVADITVTDVLGQSAAEYLAVVVAPSTLNSSGLATTPDGKGYWTASTDGAVSAFGNAQSYGSMSGQPLNQSVVGMAATPDGQGYWLVSADGGVFAFGDAPFLGSMGGHPLNQPVVGLTATPDGHGYWLVSADGGMFAFGDAPFLGSEGGHPLNQPVVGMAATPDGQGYWLVGADGGVFAFGDALFLGSLASHRLDEPVVGIAATPDGQGYWLAAADGGVFAFGDGPYDGSEAGQHLNAAIDSIKASPSGRGYWLMGADGGVFTFGGATFMGSDPGLAQSS
ncbi:MAG: fibronectin type III domain-containing protein [Acidimicrobiales bacterium]